MLFAKYLIPVCAYPLSYLYRPRDGYLKSGGKRLKVSRDAVSGSSLPSSPSLGEAGFWNTPLDSPPREDESGSRRDAVRETKRRHFDESTVAETGNGMEGLGVEGFTYSMALKGQGEGEEGGRERQCVSDVEDEGETEVSVSLLIHDSGLWSAYSFL